MTGEGDPALAIEQALAAADETLLPRLPLVGTVLGIPIEDNELTASLDPKHRKSALESLLMRYLTVRAGNAPLVLLLEDCHWLDSLSADLLDLVARAAAGLPILIVLTYRPGPYGAPKLRAHDGARARRSRCRREPGPADRALARAFRPRTRSRPT